MIGENITRADDSTISPTSTRPKRKATIAARKKIKGWLNPEDTMFVWGASRTARVMRQDDITDDIN